MGDTLVECPRCRREVLAAGECSVCGTRRETSPFRRLSILAIFFALVLAALSHSELRAEPVGASRNAVAEGRQLYPIHDWYEGADGFALALQEAQADGRAIAVYFYTDWCGYCRQLESELLERAKVESYMRDMTKIRVNPERGTNERFIAERYGVIDYPSFFVHPSVTSGPTKVDGMKRRDGEWVLKTPEEFVESIRQVAGSRTRGQPAPTSRRRALGSEDLASSGS